MTNRFITAMRANKNWLTIFLYVIVIVLFTITFFLSVANNHNSISAKIHFIGLIILFIALLHTWGTRAENITQFLWGFLYCSSSFFSSLE